VTNFGNSGTGTLRAAIDLANGTTANDTIVFDIGSSARTINLTSTLPSIEARGTAGKLEIVKQGSATLTLNGNNGGSNRDFRIFNIAAGGDFTLSGVTISGAQTSGSGAAIYNRGGIVSISDCVLTNNIAGEWGGAIRNGASENDGSELTLQRCTISNNTAADGGGISNHFGADVELYNSTLSGNTASDQGGAIYSRTTPGSANASTFTVGRSSVLKDNSAGLGGAISNRYGTLNVQGNSQIYGNNATDFGGAIYNHGTANITNATVRDNEAEDSGGGIHNNINGVLNITDSVITGNSVTKNNGVGGGIRSTGSTGSNHSDPKVTITNSQISDNHADGGSGDGGGIYADAYTILTIKGGSTISNNTAGRDGGGIYANGNTIVTIQGGSTISNNTAGRDGGGIYNNGLRLEVDSSTVSDNEADRDAGGIYSWHESKLAVNNSTISNNTSDGKGGGIFIDVGAGNYRNSVDNEIFYSNIFGNQAYQGGGIFNNGALYIYGSTIDSNIAHEEVISALDRSGDGGGIYSGNQGQLFVYDSTIRNNKADVDGGGIASYRDGGVINIPIPHKYFRYFNTLTLGVNFLIDAFTPPEPFTIYNSTIAYNQAGKYGGGIYTISATGIFNCTIAYNEAETGGGLARRDYSPELRDTLILENTISASNQGGSEEIDGVTVDVGDYHSQGGTPTDSKTFISRLIVSDDSFSVYNNTDNIIPRYFRFLYETTLPDGTGLSNYSGDPIPNLNYSGQSFGDSAINFIIADPHLGPLQDNGGPTFTMALLEHSPAIDRGNSVLSNSALDFGEVINRDQRGYNRVDGIPGGFTDRDIGAFEYQPLATTAKLLTSTSTTSAASSLKVYDPVTDTTTDVEDPFPGFTGKIHVASGDYNGDFNGDGIGDMVVGAGQGGGPVVAIIDSQTGRVITKFFAFDPAFRGGVELACLDFNLDGVMDILVGAGPGGGPHVKIFNGKDLGLLFSFYAYANDFTGGVSLCALDVNDDGIRDLVTGAGAGGAPHVKVWDGATHTLLSQWYAYDPAFRGGVNVSGGYLGSDGSVMVVTGAGAGMAPEVAVWNALTGEEISRFLAYSSQFMGGVRVRVHDGNGDGVSELVTAAGPGGAPHVKGFNFPALDLAFEFFAGNPTDTDGVAVS
jgi:predicted outer membrane repeat protein